MRALVTGGAGFIGSALCRALVGAAGWSIVNLDKLTYAANLSSLAPIEAHPNYRFIEGDIADRALLDALFADFAPEAVFHLAAETHVDRAITGSAPFIATNVVGAHVLLEASLSYWSKLAPEKRGAFRFLHVSTDEVFGALGPEGLFSEQSAYDPRSPYAASKAAGDHLARAWAHTYGLPVIVSNCSNNYGPYQFPEKFIPLMIVNAIEGEALPIYGDGAQVRDWLYVEDHVAALKLVAERGRPGETYVIGGRSERANLDVAHRVCDLLDELAPDARTGPRRALISFVPDRPGHDRRYAIDCAKIEAKLGWRAQESFEGGLRKTVHWYLERRDWWAPIRAGRYRGERLGLPA